MNAEFHYYIVYHLARKAGLADNDAWVVAYSSQNVDASTVSYLARAPEGDYATVVTQDYGWWDESYPRTVYVPFHFFPGDPSHAGARRADGAKNVLNTTPDSPRVKALLVEALRTRDLYRVGIGLHTYADSWAHQNFTGILEDWNTVDRDSPIPSIGHAQALTNPDRLGLAWEDPRLEPAARTVRNWERHRAAARMVYRYLAAYNRHGLEDTDWVIDELFDLLSPLAANRTGEERILDLVISQDLKRYERREWLDEALVLEPSLFGGRDGEQSGYDKLLWLKDAALHRTALMRRKPVAARESFASSHLHRWNEAARAHLAAAWRILPPEVARAVGMAGQAQRRAG